MASILGAHHVAFTVSDLDRSKAWYRDLLGMVEVFSGRSEEVDFVVLADPESAWVLGLRRYHQREADQFDEFRTGLDHFAFSVASIAELQAWERELARRGVMFTPITETPIGSVIVFRDPDNIQLEFWLPTGS